MSTNRARIIAPSIVVVLGSIAATIWYAIARGQDFNWDQQNYHIGIPFLLSHGTFWSSVAPSGIQSYFNPSVLQVQFWLMRHLSAMDFAVVLALLQSVAFMIAGSICGVLASPVSRWKQVPLWLLGFALCLMAPMALSEAGTTLIDFLTAVPVLAAYALLLARGRWFGSVASGVAAGMLLGTAAALKLTNGVFALGVVGFALAGPEPARKRLTWLFLCGGAAVLAFFAVGMTWQLELWRHFGNPMFPYFNAIFRSPDFLLTDLHDRRFAPRSVLDIWLYPLDWMRPWWHWRGVIGRISPGLAMPSSEVTFADGRWVVAVVGSTVFLAALAVFRRWGRRRLLDPATGLLFAFMIDYLVWIFEFDIGRYAVVLAILCGAVLLVLAMAVRPYPLRVGLLVLVAAAQWRAMVVPDWGHLSWRPYWQAINQEPLDLGRRPLIFLTVKPTLFLAASLSPDARYVGAYGDINLFSSNHTDLTRQLRKDISSTSSKSLYAVDLGATPAISVAILSSYGLKISNLCQNLQVAGESFRIRSIMASSQ